MVCRCASFAEAKSTFAFAQVTAEEVEFAPAGLVVIVAVAFREMQTGSAENAVLAVASVDLFDELAGFASTFNAGGIVEEVELPAPVVPSPRFVHLSPPTCVQACE